jgi:FKBP-type peptidyl-prolyl cis-trans isomerase FklB
MNRFVGAGLGLVASGAMALATFPPPSGTQEPKKDEKAGKKAMEFKSPKDKASFAIGLNIGRKILEDFGRADAVDPDAMLRGLKAGLGGDQSMEPAEIKEAILGYRVEVVKQDAVSFLEGNKKKEGVKTTASGLQYQVIKSGEGKKPSADSTVKVHYTGTLVNGTKFDSSVDRGEPAEFQVKGVIGGWTEALQLMKVGDKWRLFIPPELGYKDRGSPPQIPGHAVLVFEVELLDVK